VIITGQWASRQLRRHAGRREDGLVTMPANHPETAPPGTPLGASPCLTCPGAADSWCRDGHRRPVCGDAHPAADVGAARCAAAGLGRPGRHAARDRGGGRRSRGRCPDRAPPSHAADGKRTCGQPALPRTVPRRREQCWRHPGSTSRSISSRPRSATPSRDGRKQHLTLTCATAATERGGEGPWRPGLRRLNIPFPVWEMRICEPLGGRWRSRVAGQLRRTRPLTVR